MRVTGNWNLTLNSSLGPQAAILQIQSTGDGFQGTMAGTGTPSPLEDLRVEGDSVSFTADADTPVGRLKLSVSGTATGDSLVGKYRMAFGEFDFSVTRA